MLNLKKLFNEHPYIWKDFKFHIKYTNSGCRIYINESKTKYYVGGWGFDKESSVIAEMVNDLIGTKDYGAMYTGAYTGERLLSYGLGFESVKNALEYIGVKLEKIYSGDNFDVYYIDFRSMKDES